MIVGCYVLDLYCDNKQCRTNERSHRGGPNEPAQYTGPNKRYCYREARGDGWKISDKDGTAHCAECKQPPRKRS